MDGRAHCGRRIGRHRRQLRAERVRKSDVRDNSAAEECADTPFGPIEKLIRHEDIERAVFVLEAADRAGRQDTFNAEQLEPENVRAEIQLGGKNPMPGAVSRQKRDSLTAQCGDDVGTRRIAERSRERTLFAVGQFSHVVQATAADDAYCGMRHCAS